MQEDLPEEIRAALRAGARAAGARGAHGMRSTPGLTLRVGRARYPVLRLWSGGLALPAEVEPKLRGRVDVFDGTRHLFHCLIVASQEAGGEVICEFKQATPAATEPPHDYAPDDKATPDPV